MPREGLSTARRSLGVVDDAGHALPHEQPELLRAVFAEWLLRVERSDTALGDAAQVGVAVRRQSDD
jgi:hypothetical protein